jgi:hypothetical protein
MAAGPAGPDAAAAAVAVLLEEMDHFYGAAGTEPPGERLRQINEALFASSPAAHALLAWITPGWRVSQPIRSSGLRSGSPARCT